MSGLYTCRGEIADIKLRRAGNTSRWTDRTPTAMGKSDADKEEPAGQHPIATDCDAAEMIR